MPVPPIPHFHVPRPALLDLVDAGADRPLTLVVAPPGAGKTVLLATWVHERCPDALWVQCEPADSVPFGFLTKLGGVLRAADEPHWLPVADALDDAHPDPPSVVDAVLAALDRRPAVLVFDDLHVANEAGPLLARLVDGLPAGSRIVAGSRGEPPLALHRLRATDACLEVRDAELRLTADEVGALLRVLERPSRPRRRPRSRPEPTVGSPGCRWLRSPCAVRRTPTGSSPSSRARSGS